MDRYKKPRWGEKDRRKKGDDAGAGGNEKSVRLTFLQMVLGGVQ